MKKTVLSITILLLTTFLYVSCRKENKMGQLMTSIGQNPNAVTATPPNLHYASNQLKWVARALPELCKSSNFRYRMRWKLSLTNEWSENNDVLDPYYNAFSPAYTYEVNAYNNINTVFSGTNDYNRDYFMGFTYEDCIYKTNIYIDDLEYCDTTKTLVVRTVRPDGEEDSIGYFINGNNNLDSLVIDEENEEDYYCWFVRANNNCDDDNPTGFRTRECDGDTRCEPWLGESSANCADCAGQGPGSFVDYTLTLVSIHTQTDLRDKRSSASWPSDKYQENYQRHYEAACQFYVYGPLTGIDKASAIFNQLSNNWETEPNNSGGVKDNEKDVLDKYRATGKNGSLKRTSINKRGNSKSNRCNPTLVTYNQTMCFRYDPTADEIAFLFYEQDEDNNAFPALPANSPRGILGGTWGTSQMTDAWTTSSGNAHTIIPTGALTSGVWTSAGTTIIMVGGVAQLKNVYTRTINLDGEMTANFKIVSN